MLVYYLTLLFTNVCFINKQQYVLCQHIKIILITKKPMILQVIRGNRKNLNTKIPGIDQESRYPRIEKVDWDWNSHAQLKH